MPQPSSQTARRGAVGAKVGLRAKIGAVIAHHRHTLEDSLIRLLRDPFQTLMTTVVVAIALALPATLLLVVDNVRQFENNFDSFSQITVYVDNTASQQQVAEIQEKIQSFSEVTSLVYVDPQQALNEFTEASGFGSALEYLDDNPLPSVFIIEPAIDVLSLPQKAQKLIAKMVNIEQVDDAQIDMLWLQRLKSLTELGKKVVLALGGALGLGVLVIIGNSIRLAIHSRREEIIVVKLVGGTDAYVRRPFLYFGMLQGLFGALVAGIMLTIGFWWLGGSVENISQLYDSHFVLRGPGFKGFFALLGTGLLLGLAGAWLAVSKHLSHIKPR
ncbi:permease-like cell division protein FtsX [Porticoccaceae bacterium]|nr:permease-like cell division protein FtsX [Porticoccaceae bacterium]